MPPIDIAELSACKLEALDSFERFLRGDGLPAWPLEVFVEVSNLCNLKCAMCGTFSAVNPRKYMLMSEVDREFYDAGGLNRSTESVLRHALSVHAFGYGEPTIHPQFQEFIGYLSSFGLLVDFFTNGMRLDQHMCEFLVSSNVGIVYISFSGATKEDYENLYIGGEFETVLEGIRRLHLEKQVRGSRYPRIQINSIGYEHHICRLVEFVEVMASVGVTHISVKRASPDIPLLNDHISIFRPWVEGEIVKRAAARATELGVSLETHVYESSAVASEQEWEHAKQQLSYCREHSDHAEWRTRVEIADLKTLSKTIEPLPNRSRMILPRSAMELPETEVAEYLQLQRVDPSVTPCMEPFKTIYIQQDGTVKPCCFAPRGVPPLGDINKHSAEQVWRGAGYRATRQAILGGEYPWKVCGNCIEHNHAPQSHSLRFLGSLYQDWFRSCFGQEIIDEAHAARLTCAPENRLAAHLQQLGDPVGSASGRCISANLERLESEALYNLERVGGIPLEGAKLTLTAGTGTQSVAIEGWAADPDGRCGAAAVEMILDGVFYQADYGMERPDVAHAFGVGAYACTGFVCRVPRAAIAPGEHAISLRILAGNLQGYYASREHHILIVKTTG